MKKEKIIEQIKIDKIIKSVREYSREQVEFEENTSISKMIEKKFDT